MGKDELILVNAAVRACPTQAAATLDPVQRISKIRAYLSAHERRDAEQLCLVSLHERSRDSLLLAPEGPYYERHAQTSCLSQIARFQETFTPSDFLTAFAQDFEKVRSTLEHFQKALPADHAACIDMFKEASLLLAEMQTCLSFHCTLVPSTLSIPPPPPSVEANLAHISPPRSYRVAVRHSMPQETLTIAKTRPEAAHLSGPRDPQTDAGDQGPDSL